MSTPFRRQSAPCERHSPHGHTCERAPRVRTNIATGRQSSGFGGLASSAAQGSPCRRTPLQLTLRSALPEKPGDVPHRAELTAPPSSPGY
jgi:hypothetical protein